MNYFLSRTGVKRCPEKRSTLQCPMQRAAMTNGARCDGRCTALRYLSEKCKVKSEKCCAVARGAMPTARQPNS